MIKYTKIGDELFEKATDSGPLTYNLEQIALTAELSDVRCVASGGTEPDYFQREESREPELKYERYISALWKPEDCYFEIFNEEGDYRFKGPAFIHIKPGEFRYSSIRHFPDKHTEEGVYFSFHLPQNWFDWLWSEIVRRPTEPVSVRFDTFLWLMGIESHMYYEVHYNAVRLNENSAVPIKTAKFYIGRTEPEKPAEDQPPRTITEKLERELESTDAGVWAKRTFWVLVIIAAALLFRH
jgi:hypothetical protein